MRKTVGTSDRLVRGMLTVGAVLGAWVLGFSSGWGIVLLIVAAIAAATGASSRCPAYSVLGVTTVAKDESGTTHRGVTHLHRAA